MQTTDASATPPTEQRSNRSALFIVFFVVFIDLLGFGIVLPMLPRIARLYVTELVPATEQKTIGAIVGLLMSSFSLMQFFFAPIWGRVSDRVGRRPILLLGLAGSVAFYSLFGYAASLPTDTPGAAKLALALFFVARIGAGIAGATIATAQAVIADSTPPEKRKHGMALIGAAFGIGFTFGPLIGFGCLELGTAFGHAGQELIGYSAAALSLVALLLGIFLMPETLVPGIETGLRRRLLDFSALRFAFTNSAIGPVILIFFMASLGFGAFEVTLSVFLKDTFNYDESYSFLMFAYVGFVLMLTQGFLYRRLASRLSEVTFMTLGIIFMAIGVALQGWISHDAWNRYQAEVMALLGNPRGIFALLFVSLTCAVIGFSFLTPSAQALVSRRTPADRQGEILGVNQSAASLARILGPIFGLVLYQATADHILPYIGGAILLVLMLPLLPWLRRTGETLRARSAAAGDRYCAKGIAECRCERSR